MSSESPAPMTLGNAAAARVRLLVWCKACDYQSEPDPADQARWYDAETPVLKWRDRNSRSPPSNGTGGAQMWANLLSPPSSLVQQAAKRGHLSRASMALTHPFSNFGDIGRR